MIMRNRYSHFDVGRMPAGTAFSCGERSKYADRSGLLWLYRPVLSGFDLYISIEMIFYSG